jgi:hypothetical protein
MLKLQSLETQLQNLKVVFTDALANQDISIEELRRIRLQITDLEKLIEERKAFLKRQDSTN